MNTEFGIARSIEPNIIEVRKPDATEILRIAPDGRLFWKGREVETDAEFRSAMLDLAAALRGTL